MDHRVQVFPNRMRVRKRVLPSQRWARHSYDRDESDQTVSSLEAVAEGFRPEVEWHCVKGNENRTRLRRALKCLVGTSAR